MSTKIEITNADGKLIANWLRAQFPWLGNDEDAPDWPHSKLEIQLQERYDYLIGLLQLVPAVNSQTQPQARMTPAEYVAAAIRTEAPVMPAVIRLLGLENAPASVIASIETYADKTTMRILHAAAGMCTEAGEFVDQLKKHIFYGKPLDTINLEEEIGDLFWYVGIMCDTGGFDITSIMEKNIAKLRKRYPDKFTEHDALNRDTVNELSHFSDEHKGEDA